MQPKKKAGNNFNECICVMITCSSELFAERSHFLLWRRFKSELGYVNLRHICFRKINYSPVLFSILDSSPLRTPPPIHTPGGETLQCLNSSAPEKNQRKKIHQSSQYYLPISEHWIITFALFSWNSISFSDFTSHRFLWALSGFHLRLA